MRRDDDGFTVTELIVTILIFSIVTVILFNFVDGMTNVTTRSDRHVRAEQDAQTALRRMTQDIRAANPILNAGGCAAGFGDCLSFETPRPTEFSRTCEKRTVTYKLDRVAKQITRDQADQVWDTSTSACVAANVSTNVPLITSVELPTATQLFEYFDNDGVEIGVADATLDDKPTDGGTAAVRISLAVRYQKDAPVLNLASNAVLRNNR